MRRLGLTWVLLLVWLALHGQSPALSSLDTLMQSRPDSALAVLVEGYETFGASVADRHYYHLLLSEALYKNDQPQSDREALLDAMAYYDSLCEGKATRRNASIPYLAARCHYMNGVGYYEMAVLLQITPQAVGKQMRSFQKKTEKTRDGLLSLLFSLVFSFGE